MRNDAGRVLRFSRPRGGGGDHPWRGGVFDGESTRPRVSAAPRTGSARVGESAGREGLPRMDAPPVGDLGLLVSRELLAEVPEEHRERYVHAVAQFAAAKYQLGVEVARRLPALLADGDPEVAERFLAAMAEVGAAGWRTGVERERYLPCPHSAPDTAR